MRIITCSKYNAHSEPLFKELNLLKLEDIRKLQELKFYYKLVHRQLPSYFKCISVTTMNAVHQHNTRQSGNLYSDRVKHDFAKRCIRFSVIDTVNKTNTSIISKIFTHCIYMDLLIIQRIGYFKITTTRATLITVMCVVRYNPLV